MTFKRIFCCIWFMLFMGINALFAIMLPDGTDAIISRVEKYPSGKIKSAKLSEPTELNTPIGKFTFGGTVTFHENGIIRSAGVTDYGCCITIKTPVDNDSDTLKKATQEKNK